MKKLVGSLIVLTLVVGFTGITNVHALDFGKEITRYDGARGRGWTRLYDSWWNTTREDQEVEYRDQPGQKWDLEGMFLNGSALTLVGGYDFRNGYRSRYGGDIFLDVDGDFTPGKNVVRRRYNGNVNIRNRFGYDYVLDLTFDPKIMADTYKVYAINKWATLKTSYYHVNDTSGAWRYVGGGKLVGEGLVQYQTRLTDRQTGFKGGYHNAVTVDLGFLKPNTNFVAHYTMGCGNDDLIGKGHIAPVPTPEPGTLLLLGFGLLGLIGIAKKRMA